MTARRRAWTDRISRGWITAGLALVGGLAGGPRLQAQLGAKLWEFPAGGAVQSAPALGSDGTLYFGSATGKVYAVSPAGARRWEFNAGGAVVASPALGADDTVYVGSTNGRFLALSSAGGKRWELVLSNSIVSSPAVGADGTIFFGGKDQKLYALRPDGVKRWEFAARDQIVSSAAVGVDGTVYVGSRDRRLYALNPDGTKKWEFLCGNWVDSSPAIGADSLVYVGSADNRLYALDARGSNLWSFVTGGGVYASPAVGLDGAVYTASYDNKVYCLSRDGLKRWEAVLDGPVANSGVALAADGTIYVGGVEGRLYALRADGVRRWVFTAGGPINAAPTVAPDGTVYVGSDDGKLYAVRGGSGPQGGAWPMFRRDMRHTASGFVERSLPGGYAPGADLTVTLMATPPAGLGSYIVEDTPPANWQVSQISDNGYFDTGTRRVRFGPYFDSQTRALNYTATPPTGEAGLRQFLGTSQADGVERLVSGDHFVDAVSLHPADSRPADGWLTAGELTAYGAAWKRGAGWLLGPNPIPPSYLLRAVALWQGGELYGLDTNAASPPYWWANGTNNPAARPAPPMLPPGVAATNGWAMATLPLAYRLGTNFTVTIDVTPATNVAAYTVEDWPPAGWQVRPMSDQGLVDPVRGNVKWGPFFDSQPRTLTYQVTPLTEQGTFHGHVAFDGSVGEIGGQRQTSLAGAAGPGTTVARELPLRYSRGARLVVTLTVVPQTNALYYLVEDSPPANWQVGPISDDGVFDPGTREVRFGPFFDLTPRTLTYEVTPPLTEAGVRQFSGTFTVDGLDELIEGDLSMDLAPLHPADLQVIDGWLTIGELTAYGAAWKRGRNWSVGPNPVPSTYLARAIALWAGGEAYTYTTLFTNAPLWWVGITNPLGTNAWPPALLPGTVATNGAATAQAPLTVRPGTSFTVTVVVAPATNVIVFAAEDQPPPGWQVTGVSTNGVWDSLRGKVKWGPFFDDLPRTLSYQVVVPLTATNTGRFYGVASFDGQQGEIAGSREVRLSDQVWPGGFALRTLPPAYAPGARMVVTVDLLGVPENSFRVVEETPPLNWSVVRISDAGVFDPTNRVVRFGPFVDSQPRHLTYEVIPPSGESGLRRFTGAYTVDWVRGRVDGDETVSPILLHPADSQPLDSWLTIGELTAYGAAWRRGSVWPAGPSPIPSSYVLRAVSLWETGELYGYETNLVDAPGCWVPATNNPVGSGIPALLPAGTVATNGWARALQPLFFRPGSNYTVAVTVTPASNVVVYAVEDRPPAGWAAGQISDEGRWDAALGKVKWGPYFDDQPRHLSYQVTPVAGGTNGVRFQGVAAFDGQRGEIQGGREARQVEASLPGGLARRQLPPGYSPGAVTGVSLQTAPLTNRAFYVVQDTPPAGWVVGRISDDGVYDATNRVVKFGPFLDGLARRLSYEVTPPLSETDVEHFAGTITVDGMEAMVEGDDTVSLIPLHPADAQPIDHWLTVSEVTAYGAAWRRGAVWPLAPNPIPDDYLTHAIELWRGGEVYRWDTNLLSGPAWWVSAGTNEIVGLVTPVPWPPGTMATNGQATAQMSRASYVGTNLTITLAASPGTNVLVYALEDLPPAGWRVVTMSAGGVWDAQQCKVKWGPFFDNEPRALSYVVEVPAGASGTGEFRGVAAFDGARGAVSGTRQVWLLGPEAAPNAVRRVLPPAYIPGGRLVVTLRADDLAGRGYYVVEDLPPAGWAVGAISHDGYFDPVNRRVKFGPFFDGAGRTLAYEITPPVSASVSEEFFGLTLVEGVEGMVGGDAIVAMMPPHPADHQPIDAWMTLPEVTAYGAAWKRGATWPSAPNPIPAAFLTRAIELWRGGERYGLDPATTNAPQVWVNATNEAAGDRVALGVPPGANATNGVATVAMSKFYRPGTPFLVTLTLTPATNVLVYGLEDQPPTGWQVVQISPGGVYDPRRAKVKWGPFFDAAARTLTYQVLPPEDAISAVRFTGGAAFDGLPEEFAGRRQTFLGGAPVAPALAVLVLPGTGVQVGLAGVASEVYELQASTNLVTWTSLTTFTNATTTNLFLDTAATNYTRRFYRALWR